MIRKYESFKNIFNFLKRKKQDDKVTQDLSIKLFKKFNNGTEIIKWIDNHDIEYFTKNEIDKLKNLKCHLSLIRRFKASSSNCKSIFSYSNKCLYCHDPKIVDIESEKGNSISILKTINRIDIECNIEKFNDDWFLFHSISRNANVINVTKANSDFYLCDTIEGVIQISKEILNF